MELLQTKGLADKLYMEEKQGSTTPVSLGSPGSPGSPVSPVSPVSPGFPDLYPCSRGASFKSMTSYNSFRSCRTYKSFSGMSSLSRTTYRSCVSGLTKEGTENQGYYDCKDDDFDTRSFYSVCDNEKQPASIMSQLTEHRHQGSTSSVNKEGGRGSEIYLGYIFAVLAGITFTASNVLVNLVPTLEPWTLLLVRSVLQLLVMFPLLLYTKSNPLGPRGHRIAVVLQGVVGGILLLSIYLAVKRMPIGDVAAIFFSAPAVTLVLSGLILRERLGIYRGLVVLSIMSGVILLARPAAIFIPEQENLTQALIGNSSEENSTLYPPQLYREYKYHLVRFNVLGWPVNFNKDNRSDVCDDVIVCAEEGSAGHTYDVIGVIAAASVPVLSAYLVILTRQSKDVHYSVLVFWFGLGGLVISVIGATTLGDPQIFSGTQEWVLAFLIAALGIVGNVLMTKACCWVKPGKVMILRSFEVIAAYILQICVFKTSPVWLDIGGNILVMIAVLMMAVEDLILKHVTWRFF